jgi:hypothetical protein
MKTTNYCFKGIAMMLFLFSLSIFSQEQQPLYVGVTTMHWNMDLEDFSMDEWKNGATEYHEKVTMKNEYILSTSTLLHRFTMDNSEVLFVTVYSSWDNIDNATERTGELVKEAWSDEAERKAFFKNQGKFFANNHSDEIYQTIPGARSLEETDLPMLYYVRTSYFAFPEDGTNEEFTSLFNEFNDAVTHQNEYYKAYFPQVHFYGADRTEFVEVFLTESLAELEKGIVRQGELFRAHWADEEARDAYNKKRDKYYTGVHSDRIYSSVPELHKAIPQPED